ncbi:MAG: energy-coupled thiamine transporter ThiT [Clostridia bacterium]|nr:energy-coupled thiamine transporter ThiT [Clostridia bacterium]
MEIEKREKKKFENPVVKLTFSALMIALGTVLSMFRIIRMPIGGSVTILSMLPVILVAYIYGTKWGLFTGSVYGILQLVTGLDSLMGHGYSLLIIAGSIIFDYILAYTSLGFGGIFKNIIKNHAAAFALGTTVCCILRFLCHFVSGFVLWGDLSGDAKGSILYSLTYNLTYMGPESLVTILGAAILASPFSIKKADKESK